MKQLSPADSQMLFIESPAAPNHVAPLSIYDPSTAPGGKVTFKGILANLESRLHLAPAFRRKLLRVPLDIDEPYWVDDPDFDLEYHVRHLALPKPGDWRQLCILVARLISRPLDHSRPMWEMNVIEGLDNIEGLPPGCFAILFKIHHAMIDGKAGVELINALHDLEPTPPAPKRIVDSEPWQPEPIPSQWQLATVGLKRLAWKPGQMLRLAARTMPGLITNSKKIKVPFRVPKTPLNGQLTGARVYDARFFDLGDFKTMRQLMPGSTINDLALSIVSGALRHYLQARKSLPKEALIASVPISIRSADSTSQNEGNELIIQNIPIYSNIADPEKRLTAICEAMRDTKEYVNAVGAKKLSEVSTAIPGRVGGLMANAMNLVAEMSGETMMCNTVITNVPGVQVPLYMTGAKAVIMCGGGPLNGTIGVIHLVGSYCGRMHINITACRDLLPDPGFYMECLDKSFAEHMAAAQARASEPSPPAAKKSPAAKAKAASPRAKPKATPRAAPAAKAKAKGAPTARSKTRGPAAQR